MGLTKLGPHCIKSTPEGLAWARVAPVVKALDDPGVLAAAPDGAIRVHRHYFPDPNLDAEPQGVADAIIGSLNGYRHPRLYAEVYVGVPGSLAARHVAFLSQIVPILHAAGLRVCGPGWYTGDYEANAWRQFRLVRWVGLHAISVQAYWGLPAGTPLGQLFTPWNALRWRAYWQAGDPPVIVTECGRDKVRDGDPSVDGGMVGKGGWLADGLSEEQYLAELVAYDAALDRPHEIGATAYTAGPTDDWRAYTLDPLCARLAALAAPVGPSPIPAPPAPTPNPAPPPNGGTMADVVLSVPERHSHASDNNWGVDEPFGPCIGVVVHSTGGRAATLADEYVATINWFQDGARQDVSSTQRIIGASPMLEVNTSVHDGEKAYGAREPANTNRRHIELAHPDTDIWNARAYPDWQYQAAGELIARWHRADAARGWDWPIRLLTRAEAAIDAPGIAYHRDLPAGIADGKRDPTGLFDGARLISAALFWQATLPTSPPPARPPHTDPIPPTPGHWPNGRAIASNAEYEAHCWGPVYQAAQALFKGGNGALGDDQDAHDLLVILGRSKRRHGAQ